MAAIWGYAEPIRVLCARDLQASIKESFHAELKAAIATYPWLEAHYDVGIDYLKGSNGTEFIFRGLRHNTGSIKSLAKIDLTIVEEAEDVPEASWLALEATVFRQLKSEMWVIWNPRLDGSPVDSRFRKSKPEGAMVVEMNHGDNPWFPPGLEKLRKHQQTTLDPATYAHIWEGAYLQNSDSQVLARKVRVAEFVPGANWDGPYHGADWGFAQDPTTAVKCWVNAGNLYVEYEAYRVSLEIDETAEYLKKCVPGIENHVIRADSARPETISYLKRKGLPRIEGVKKWPGSVEDGVSHMRSYGEIIIHPRCVETIKESRLYSYKVDRLSGDILPEIVDANNHCIAEGQRVLTARGIVPIECVNKNDLVMTREGFRRVLFAGVTDTNRSTLKIKTTLGELICTPDHRVFVNGVFATADTLRYNDAIVGDESWLKQLSLKERFTGAIQRASAAVIEFISKGLKQPAQKDCIASFGSATMGQYQKDGTFITKTETHQTMTLQILSVLLHTITFKSTQKLKSSNCLIKSIWTKLGTLQKHGIQAKKELQSIERLALWPIKNLCRLKKLVSTVKSFLLPKKLGIKISFVATNANQQPDENLGLTMKKEAAQLAMNHLSSIDTQKHNTVAGRVLSVTEGPMMPRVYDLTIEGQHEFFCEGVLVHNCIDSIRYALAPLIKSPKADIVMEFL